VAVGREVLEIAILEWSGDGKSERFATDLPPIAVRACARFCSQSFSFPKRAPEACIEGRHGRVARALLLFILLLEHVRIDVQSHRRAGVSQATAHGHNVDAI